MPHHGVKWLIWAHIHQKSLKPKRLIVSRRKRRGWCCLPVRAQKTRTSQKFKVTQYYKKEIVYLVYLCFHCKFNYCTPVCFRDRFLLNPRIPNEAWIKLEDRQISGFEMIFIYDWLGGAVVSDPDCCAEGRGFDYHIPHYQPVYTIEPMLITIQPYYSSEKYFEMNQVQKQIYQCTTEIWIYHRPKNITINIVPVKSLN